ncbi:MAG: hypothetical protein ACLT5A_12870 [Clostridiaceae bacterium]
MGTPWGEFIPRADLYLPQKGMDISMKKWKIAGLFAMALMMSVTPLQAFATSPEFAYTAEKWASLQDNKLEYGEIADLIHEYNTTVRQNELDYQKYKGKTSTDTAKEYYDSASEVSERISYPDDDSANYAGQIAQALNSEISVDNLTEQGDNNVDDGEIKRLGYEQAEKSIVQQAQKLMISYYSGKHLWIPEDARLRQNHIHPQTRNPREALQSGRQCGEVTNATSPQAANSSQTRQQLIIIQAGTTMIPWRSEVCRMWTPPQFPPSMWIQISRQPSRTTTALKLRSADLRTPSRRTTERLIQAHCRIRKTRFPQT